MHVCLQQLLAFEERGEYDARRRILSCSELLREGAVGFSDYGRTDGNERRGMAELLPKSYVSVVTNDSAAEDVCLSLLVPAEMLSIHL